MKAGKCSTVAFSDNEDGQLNQINKEPLRVFFDMLMEAISTYGEFNLHSSVTRTADICHSHDNTYKMTPLSEEATLRK